ncbi:fec operon regulator FecR [Sphingobacterium multivorum]|uniref:Fec operon regulator FecR n=2 Tax=Bacteroidota TaxID=976 RepID=A0A2X2JM69_SPHMU|nr:DUF4974 domain-containing protein [Chryseobacterium bernardetii]SPZ95018.1 fec operon regulator FecR [Sphingobacterium multivorum]
MYLIFLFDPYNSIKAGGFLKPKDITILFEKYLAGSVTPEELAKLLSYFELDEHSDKLKECILSQLEKPIPDIISQDKIDRLAQQLDSTILLSQPIRKGPARMHRLIRWLPAAMLIAVGAISYLLWTKKDGTSQHNIVRTEILSGTNRATLTLDGGKPIHLSESEAVLTNGKGFIGYGDGRSLIASDTVKWVTVTTPRAGQYQLVLEDGTRIWLNADSRVRYPARFTGNERRISVSGEVYLEVAKSQVRHSFIVETSRQIIQVLGTKFNVKAYPESEIQSTTLLEGAVKVKSKKYSKIQILKPGQQLKTSIDGLTSLQQVDAEDYAGWTNGQIMLNSLTLSEVTRELERWYDVQFEAIPDGIAQKKVFGSLKRNLPLKDVLKALEVNYNIAFAVNERRVYIKRK